MQESNRVFLQTPGVKYQAHRDDAGCMVLCLPWLSAYIADIRMSTSGGGRSNALVVLLVVFLGSRISPSPRLIRRSPDVGSSLGNTGIAGEVVVFKRTFNPSLCHAIGISGDTERNISSGGPVLVLDPRSESFKGQIR